MEVQVILKRVVFVYEDFQEFYKRIEKIESKLSNLESKTKPAAGKDDKESLTIGSGASFNYPQSRSLDSKEEPNLRNNLTSANNEAYIENQPEKSFTPKTDYRNKIDSSLTQEGPENMYNRTSNSFKSTYLDSVQKDREKHKTSYSISKDLRDERDYRLSEKQKEIESDHVLLRRGTSNFKSMIGTSV